MNFRPTNLKKKKKNALYKRRKKRCVLSNFGVSNNFFSIMLMLCLVLFVPVERRTRTQMAHCAY